MPLVQMWPGAEESARDATATALRLLGDGPVAGGVTEYAAQQVEGEKTDWASVALAALMGAPIGGAVLHFAPDLTQRLLEVIKRVDPARLDPATLAQNSPKIRKLIQEGNRAIDGMRTGEPTEMVVYRGHAGDPLPNRGTFVTTNPAEALRYAGMWDDTPAVDAVNRIAAYRAKIDNPAVFSGRDSVAAGASGWRRDPDTYPPDVLDSLNSLYHATRGLNAPLDEALYGAAQAAGRDANVFRGGGELQIILPPPARPR